MVLVESFQSRLEAEGAHEDMVLVESFQSRHYTRGDVTSQLMHAREYGSGTQYVLYAKFFPSSTGNYFCSLGKSRVIIEHKGSLGCMQKVLSLKHSCRMYYSLYPQIN
jgi:hypothetical protein